jgi:PAS domain S-box-containing protein
MSWTGRLSPAVIDSTEIKSGLQTASVVFFAYLIAAEAAFFIGTLSDKIFAPFWPPNIVLLCALLYAAPERRWICVAAAIPAHVIAELKIGMPISAATVAFITNLTIAILNVAAIHRFLGGPPWLSDVRKASIYVITVGALNPALVALAGAFVPILAGGELDHYWSSWAQWFAANALGDLTLGPAALIIVSEGIRTYWPRRLIRQAEAALLALALIAICNVALGADRSPLSAIHLSALLYSPLPLILWSAARFGVRGASTSTLIVALVLIWRTLNGPTVFSDGDAGSNVFSLQVFLASLAVPVLLLGASIDEARRAARQIREDEARIAFVAATANVGLWKYDLASGDFWATDHCRTMFGLSTNAELSRDLFLDSVFPEDRHIAFEFMSGTLQNLDTPTAEFRICVPPDSQTRWILGRASRVRDSKGSAGISGAFTDITSRKTAEHEADLQRREIAHLMRVSQVGGLSGGLAHELTQPLTAILANAQAARVLLSTRKPDLRVLAEILDDIIEEDNRAGEVIQRLRMLLKNGDDRFEPVDLNNLINSTLRLLNSELIGRRIHADTFLAESISLVSADPVQLQQVLLNLIMNAVDSVNQMPTSRRVITLTTRILQNRQVEVSVADRGTGIGLDDQKRIFEPFFTTKERGLGLGLSICTTIIARHGGVLSLDNNPLDGATASFRLPAPEHNGGSYA